MSMQCPNCDAKMENKGISGDYKIGGRVTGVDISQWNCPNCEGVVDDFGNFISKRDRQHEHAKMEYRLKTGSLL